MREATRTEADAIALSGPRLSISKSAVTSLSLILHELGTNSAKYGALSVENGSIRVEWEEREGKLHLRWEESGGPNISEPPQATGFGSLLVKRSIEQLGGRIDHDWLTDGLAVQMVIPVERISA